MNVSKPLPLDGAHNVRDLGGYSTKSGKETKQHIFLRGDSLHGLTKEDKEFLDEYGVRFIIDVRSKKEAFLKPDRFDKKNIESINIPLFDHIQSTLLKGKMPDSMDEMYIGLIEESKDGLKQIFEHMAQKEGVVLYHCTAGKDRTGIITMIVLRLAGVADDAILADYAVSAANMKETFDRQREMVKNAGIKVPDYVFESNPEFMQKLMAYIDQTYGSVENYLKEIGLSEETLETLKNKIV